MNGSSTLQVPPGLTWNKRLQKSIKQLLKGKKKEKRFIGAAQPGFWFKMNLTHPLPIFWLKKEWEQPPSCSRRQGLAHNSARLFSVLLSSLLWHSRFSLAATHCAVLRELMKFWCALKMPVLNFWLNWLWLCRDDSTISKVSGFASHRCWH